MRYIRLYNKEDITGTSACRIFSCEHPTAEQEHIILPREHLPAEQEHISCEYPTSERRQTTLFCITSACRQKEGIMGECAAVEHISLEHPPEEQDIMGTQACGAGPQISYEHPSAEQEHSLIITERTLQSENYKVTGGKKSFCRRRTQCNNNDCSALRTGITCSSTVTDTWRRLTSTYQY